MPPEKPADSVVQLCLAMMTHAAFSERTKNATLGQIKTFLRFFFDHQTMMAAARYVNALYADKGDPWRDMDDEETPATVQVPEAATAAAAGNVAPEWKTAEYPAPMVRAPSSGPYPCDMAAPNYGLPRRYRTVEDAVALRNEIPPLLPVSNGGVGYYFNPEWLEAELEEEIRFCYHKKALEMLVPKTSPLPSLPPVE
jgi:hypothetical protein